MGSGEEGGCEGRQAFSEGGCIPSPARSQRERAMRPEATAEPKLCRAQELHLNL